MFEAAVTKFVKAVGEESLVPVPSLDEAEKCRPMHVVVKKKRRWFWQQAKYEATPFQLHDLLTRPELVPVELNNRKLVTYNKVHQFSIHGNIGSKLKAFLEAELAGSDTVNVNVPLGDVYKFEVDQQDLIEKLETRYIDLEHEFIKQVTSQPRKALCLIVGTAYPLNDCVLSTCTKLSGKEEFDVNKVADMDEEGDLNTNLHSSMTAPKNTPLAFNARELRVSPDGSIRLIVDPDSRGGFIKEDESDGTDLLDDDAYFQSVHRGIHQLPDNERTELATHIQNICGHPNDVHVLYDMIKVGCMSAEHGDQESLPASELHHKMMSNREDYMYLLNKVGFNEQGDTIAYPSEPSAFLEAAMCLIEALIQLDDDETLAFKDCNRNLAQPLLYLLENATEGKQVKIADPKLTPLYDEANTGQAFIQALGFQIRSDSTLLPPSGRRSAVEGAFRVVHSLWGKRGDEEKGAPPGGRCSIL